MSGVSYSALYAEAMRHAQRWFWEADGEAARRYLLEERSISSEVAREVGVGFLPTDDRLVGHLRRAGATDADLKAAGLGAADYRGQLVDRPLGGGYLTLPIRSPDGEVIGLKFRAVPGLARPDALRYTGTRGPMSGAMFGLSAAPSAAERLVVVEGEIDQLSVATARTCCAELPPTIALHGKELTEERRVALAGRVRAVTLMLDGNDAGRHAIVKAGRALARSGVAVDVLRLPDGMDPNTALKTMGAAGFAAFLVRTPAIPLLVAEAHDHAHAGLHRCDPFFVARQLQHTVGALGPLATREILDAAAAVVNLPATVMTMGDGIREAGRTLPTARPRVRATGQTRGAERPAPRTERRVAV